MLDTKTNLKAGIDKLQQKRSNQSGQQREGLIELHTSLLNSNVVMFAT
jgi:hypothetical protein